VLIHDHWVRDVTVSADGSLVAGSALRNDLRLWDAKTGAERFKLLGNGDLGGKRKVRFTPDGKRLVAWGDDFYLRVWDTRNGKLLAEHRTMPDGFTENDFRDDRRKEMFLMTSIGGAAISVDGSAFALSSHKSIQIFDVETGKERMKFVGDPSGVAQITFSPDGKRLAVGGSNNARLERLADGRQTVIADKNHTIAVWDLAAQKVVWSAQQDGSSPSGLEFSPDGSRLASISLNVEKGYAVRLWDAVSGKDAGRFSLPGVAYHLAFDPTGKRLAVSFRDTTATVYDLETALKPKPAK
jgi:WD40 repeat protein